MQRLSLLRSVQQRTPRLPEDRERERENQYDRVRKAMRAACACVCVRGREGYHSPQDDMERARTTQGERKGVSGGGEEEQEKPVGVF